MKKILSVSLVLLLALSLFAAGTKEQADSSTLVVGATPPEPPHAAFLELVVEDLAQQGITLKIQEFTDYVTPNEALESGELDANFFQHIPYLESFNKEKGYHLANAGGSMSSLLPCTQSSMIQLLTSLKVLQLQFQTILPTKVERCCCSRVPVC